MKYKKLESMSKEKLEELILVLKMQLSKALFKKRGIGFSPQKVAGVGSVNPKEIMNIKKSIARVKTVLNKNE